VSYHKFDSSPDVASVQMKKNLWDGEGRGGGGGKGGEMGEKI